MKAGITAKEAIVAHVVTESRAEAILAELRPWLRDRPPIDQFREQLEATTGRFWTLRRATAHLRAANEAVRQACRSTLHAKTALLELEKSSAALQMSNFVGPRLRDALVAVNELQEALSRIPEPFSGQEKARKGPAPRAWYSLLVRDLANIAWEIGIDLTTAGNRADDPAARPSPDLSLPSRSCCRTDRDRRRWQLARGGSIGRLPPRITSLVGQLSVLGGGQSRSARARATNSVRFFVV
jgi:hypothetical protein